MKISSGFTMYFELKQELFDRLREICMETRRAEESMSVTRMLTRLMDLEGLPMHCPYHHFIVPAALLTQSAVFEKRDVSELSAWLDLAEERAKTVPAGFCGECGTCGSAVGVGMFLSIYTGATPKSVENWQQANEITGICLQKIAAYPGPRCCKRTSFLAVNEGVPYLNEKLGLEFTIETDPSCTYHNRNAECLEGECPFYEGGEAMRDTGRAIIVEAEKMPKKDPAKICKCMNEPVKLESKKGTLFWVKQTGDTVKKGEVICEGEVEKKTVEFPAPCDGVLTQQCVGDGEVFTAGDILGYVRPCGSELP